MDARDALVEGRFAAAGSGAPEAPPGWNAGAMALLRGAETVRPAGIWRRAAALAIDVVIVRLLLELGELVTALLAARDAVARAFDLSYMLVVPAAYFVLTHGTTGQTLGKRLTGVRVVSASGERIGYGRALARLGAAALSLLPLGVGFLVAVVRRDRRALHDLVAGTRAIRVP